MNFFMCALWLIIFQIIYFKIFKFIIYWIGAQFSLEIEFDLFSQCFCVYSLGRLFYGFVRDKDDVRGF